MVGFYSGGKSRRGLSLKNMTKMYRHALILGGEDPEKAKKYSYHGGKRGNITYQKSFGGVSDKRVALGSKHAVGNIIGEYTDANRCELSEPAKTQCDIRDKMQAVLGAKVGEARTPRKSKIPGEVYQKKGNVSPSEVREMNKLLKANGLEMEKLREINKYHPGFQKCVLELAANSVVGISPGGCNLKQRAIGYLKKKRKEVEENSKECELKYILKVNGLEMEKLAAIEKHHHGFTDCVLNLARNSKPVVPKNATNMELRAKNYLRNKRKLSGYQESFDAFRSSSLSSSSNTFHDTKLSVGGCANGSISMLEMEKQSFGFFENSRESYSGVRKQLSQQFNYSAGPVEPRVIYNGPVYNNCSFDGATHHNECASDVSGRNGVFAPRFSKKKRPTGEVERKKKKYKSAAELGLVLN